MIKTQRNQNVHKDKCQDGETPRSLEKPDEEALAQRKPLQLSPTAQPRRTWDRVSNRCGEPGLLTLPSTPGHDSKGTL